MSRRKLLLADDSITIQKVVNLTFADEGIDVVTVGDGDAALAQLLLDTPDILLADVNMPGPTGYEICERLRSNDATRNVPVILLVGSFEPFDESEATRVGANAYLTKPFQSIKQLIAQVNQLIDAAPRAVEDVAPIVAENGSLAAEPFTSEQPETDVADSFATSSTTAETIASSQTTPRQFDDLGYEVSQPAAETTPLDIPQADDIDSLYAQSISGGSDAVLSDVGIDDEMIETSYSAAEPTEKIGSFETVPETSEPVETSSPVETQPEPTFASTETEVGFRSGYDQRFPDDPSKFENTISYQNWRPADMRDEPTEQPAANPFETAPLNEPGPQPVEEAAPAPAPASVGDDTIRMEGRFDTKGSAAYQFDDVDLLDLSGENNAPVEITSPAHAHEQGSSKQVVTLSPELIEMIAQRVVEKLSEKY